MTLVTALLILIILLGHVGGEIALKHAMTSSNTAGFRSRKFFAPFCVGILLMTIQFFLGIGLLQRYDLSFIYPFQGLGVIIITIAAAVFLHERITVQLALGSALISAGVILVSLS